MNAQSSPERITLKSIEESLSLFESASRKALKFSQPRSLSFISDLEAMPLLAPGSALGIYSVSEDEASAVLAKDVAISCAKEGVSVLHLSSASCMNKLYRQLYESVASGSSGESMTLTRTEARCLDSLRVFHLDIDYVGSAIDSEAAFAEILACDADLVVVEEAPNQTLCSFLGAASKGDVPIVYTGEATRAKNETFRLDTEIVPSHILLMDRSLTEEEAESPDRPYWGMRECRILLPDIEKHIMNLPFLGTFTLAYNPDTRSVGDVVDEFEGHVLSGEIHQVEIGDTCYTIVEPEYYGRKLELLYE